MGNWAVFLTALAGPIAKRVMLALGLSVVTYAGIQGLVVGLLAEGKGALQGLPADVIGLLGLSGLWVALGMVAGAILGALALIPLKRIIPS